MSPHRNSEPCDWRSREGGLELAQTQAETGHMPDAASNGQPRRQHGFVTDARLCIIVDSTTWRRWRLPCCQTQKALSNFDSDACHPR